MFEIFKLNKKKKELEDQIAQLKADISSMQVEIDNYDEHRKIAAHQYENTMRSAKAAQSILSAIKLKYDAHIILCATIWNKSPQPFHRFVIEPRRAFSICYWRKIASSIILL